MYIEIFESDCEIIQVGEVVHLICSTEFEGIDVAYCETDEFIKLTEKHRQAKSNHIHAGGSPDDIFTTEEELTFMERDDKRFEEQPSYIIVCGDWQPIE